MMYFFKMEVADHQHCGFDDLTIHAAGLRFVKCHIEHENFRDA